MRHLRKRLVRAAAVVVGLVLGGMATTVQAGTFYTVQATFDAAWSSPLVWSENFEGFTPSVLPAVPLSIAGGQAEIFTRKQVQEI